MRQSVLIKNTNKFGKVTPKWYVRIGKEWRLFSQKEWESGGLAWVQKQLSSPVIPDAEAEDTA